ncbi:hypothetical protein BN1263390090 [Stenotrophomonas maltophilia]|nr:hypothetical protein BN1263390090 [Stenotrophomonas maltophilia]
MLALPLVRVHTLLSLFTAVYRVSLLVRSCDRPCPGDGVLRLTGNDHMVQMRDT